MPLPTPRAQCAPETLHTCNTCKDNGAQDGMEETEEGGREEREEGGREERDGGLGE